jgi:glycosyltransferase involved in cell wall biosynthesis
MNALPASKRLSPLPVVLDARVVAGSGGGPDKTIINSPRYQLEDGYRMLCVYLRRPADTGFAALEKKAAAKGVELIAIDDTGPFDWRVVPRLLEVCRRERVAIWHGHDYKTNLLGLILKRFHPMRLVTTVHGWVHQTSRTPLYYWLDRLSLKYYEKVLCVSVDLEAECRKAGVPASRCMLLENGIEEEQFTRTKSPEDARRELNLNPSRLLIGAAGRLSPEKGFDLLIRAGSELLREGFDFELVIVGEGGEFESLQKLIQELNVSERIRLLGFRSDLRQLYEAFDIYALSSYREGLPNVLLEAMSMSVPVVATAVNGVPNLIQHESNGLLIAPGSVETLTVALRKLLQDPSSRNRYAFAGRQTIEKRYRFRLRMKRLSVLYDSMLGQ